MIWVWKGQTDQLSVFFLKCKNAEETVLYKMAKNKDLREFVKA